MSDRIGKYEIQAEIGRGGFGRVYKGYDPTVGRVVAIKVLLPDTSDPEFLTRFKMEATTAGNLHHPNLVTIHEFGEENDNNYLVMEFLDGEDLQAIIKDHRPLPILDKVEIMQQVAAGLHCAHESGVIHRDVKPSNIMVLRDNLVKIMDFGIARLTRSETTRFTRAGFLVGTLNYMAPEQFRDQEPDALSDIWAFGAIYYEFVTGRFPFEGSSTPAILYAITTVDPPAPSALVPDCPEALSHIIMRAIAKDRDLRYQSLQELQLDVGPLLLDLRRNRANALLPEARDLFEQERGEEAQRVVRRILDLDPLHPEARQLRERIQRLAQRQAIGPKVEAFRKAGQQQLAQGRAHEAIQSFESALRLDTANTEIRELLESARSTMGHYKRAQELAEAAAKRADERDFTGAHELVKQAFEVDPTNARAREIMSRVQHAFDSAERRKEVDALIERAAALPPAEALPMLREASARLREPEALVKAIADTEAARKIAAERERVREVLSSASRMLDEDRVPEAEQLLNDLLAQHPDDSSILQLINRCGDVQRLINRRDAVRRVTDRVKVLQDDGELDRALALVRRALEEFRGEPQLIELEESSSRLVKERDDRRGVEEALRQAWDLRAAGKLDSALRHLREAAERFGAIPALLSLASEIETDLTSGRAREAVRKTAAEVRSLAARSDWNAAAEILRKALADHPGDPELTALSESVERNRSEEQKRRERDGALAAARALRSKGDIPKALEEVRKIRDRFGSWPALADFESELAVEQDLRAKREEVSKAAAEARQHISKANWEEARSILRAALEKYQNEPELTALLDSVERGLSEQQAGRRKEEMLRNAHDLESKGREEEAIALLDAALREFPGDPGLPSLRKAFAARAADRKRADEFSVRSNRIAQAIDSGQFEAARREIEEAARHFGDQSGIRRLSDELEVKQRIAALDQTARAIEQDMERGEIGGARQKLTQALASHPRDARLLRLSQSLESEAVFFENLSSAEQHLNAHRLDLAETSLRSAAANKPNHPALQKLNQRLAKEREKAASERAGILKKATGLADKSQFDEAIALLRGILDRHPDDAEAIKAMDRVNSARGLHIKRTTYAARLNELEAKRKADKPQLVKEAAAVMLAEFPADQQLRDLMTWADRRLHEIGASSIHAIPQPKPSAWKYVAALGAAAIAMAAGVYYFVIRNPEAGASWSVSTSKIPFQWRLGDELPDPKQIALSSARGVVSLKAASSAKWLTIDPGQAITPGQFSVAIAPAGMTPGEYKTTIVLTAENAEPKSRSIEVSLRVNPRAGVPPTQQTSGIFADTELLTFEMRHGATTPDTKIVRLRGNGVTQMSAVAHAKGNWLKVIPASAQLPAAVSIQVSAEGLNPGPYQGDVVFTAAGSSNLSQRVNISLRIREPDKPISQNPPPVKPDPPKQEPPKQDPPKQDPPHIPTGTYGGLRRGNITWVGELPPGQKVTISKEGVSAGPGTANGQFFPGDVAINVEARTQGIQIESAPSASNRFSQMVLVNAGSAPVSLIQVRWTLRE